VPAYGALSARLPRNRLVAGVLAAFVAIFAGFWGLAHVAAVRPWLGIPFFLWMGVFSMMVVAQFWAFANDLYSVERGERLFPIVGVGGSLGALVGARAASKLMAAHLASADLMAIAAAGLLVCIGLNTWVARRDRARTGRRTGAIEERPLAPNGAFRLILGDRYLRSIGLLVVLVNVVNTIGEYILGRLVLADAAGMIASGTAGGLTKPQLVGVFYGNFFAWVNLVSLFMQLFVVSRVFKRVGVGGALFVLPLIASCSYGLLAVVPILGAVRFGKVLENSTEYSLQNTARHALFLPTTREAKFKAKQAIDALCWRLGDLLQAVIVFAGVHLAFGVRDFALVNEALVLVWLTVALGIYREYGKQTAAHSQDVAA
jgi:AAA family ATP:ADP antiporter